MSETIHVTADEVEVEATARLMKEILNFAYIMTGLRREAADRAKAGDLIIDALMNACAWAILNSGAADPLAVAERLPTAVKLNLAERASTAIAH
jgi:hypothetical protein